MAYRDLLSIGIDLFKKEVNKDNKKYLKNNSNIFIFIY